jgi:hypothetical protein
MLGLPPSVGHAQDVASIRRHIAELEQRKVELIAATDSLQALERARRLESLDSLQVGALRLLAAHPMVGVARRQAATAWASLRATLGDSVAALMHQRRFVLVTEDAEDSTQVDAQGVATLGTVLVIPRNSPENLTAINIIVAVYGELWRSLDPGLRDWLSAPLTPTLDTIAVTSASYLELVTSGSPVSRGCYQGSLADCAGALGLTEPDHPALAWYSAEGRRELVARLSQALSAGADREVFAGCVIQRVDADCVALLQQNERLVPPPLSGGTRASYFLTALKLGGSGALSRLLGSSGEPSMARRLELAAGTSLDAVTTRWRSAVLATRPHPTQLTASTACAGMVWIAGLLLLSFRSSRWR